jgi:hypothetical protein
MKPCPRCGTQFDPLQGKYAPDGSVICAVCGDRAAAAAQAVEAKNNASAFIGSFGAVIIALASFCVQHRFIFFLFPVAAIAVGVGTALTALRNPAAAQALGWRRIPTIVIGALGALLGLLALAFNFFVNFLFEG